jgi:hypothetical protein
MIQMRRCAVIALGGILLVGCSDGADEAVAPSGTEVSVSPSPTKTDVEQVPNLPVDCGRLGSAATRAETTGDLDLYDEAPVLVRTVPQGAVLELGCEWFGGDITGVTVTISTAAPDAVTAAVGTLSDQGYTCTQDLGGRLCTVFEESPMSFGGADGTVETQQMVFARDGVWVYMSTSNMDGQVLLSEIITGIFD